MKFLFSLLAFSILLFFACKKSNDDKHPTGVPTSAETMPQYDNTNFGVYKGVVLGSSGILIIKVNNGENSIKGYLTIDNVKDTLSTTQSVTINQEIRDLRLKGQISSMALFASADGSWSEARNLVIAGHPNAEATILHETSKKQVLLYEGNFKGVVSGRINIVKEGTGPGSNNVRFIAKVSNENNYLYGGFYTDSSSRTRSQGYTHLIHSGVPLSAPQTATFFEGFGKFNLSNASGIYEAFSFVNGAVGKGTFECQRTY